MTTGCKTTTVFLTILCALLLTILGLTQEWPPWAWATLAVLLIGVPAAAFKVAAVRRGSVPVDFEEQRTAVPIERREHRVSHVALPSQWADYDFVFSATIRWYPLEAHSDDPVVSPAGLAVEAVLDRARAITERREPGRASLVQHELSGVLSTMRPDRTGQLQVMAEDVTLTLREPDQERLDKLAEVRKDKAVWEHQRKYEQSKREYLGEDVLKDTGSAVVWWLAKNDDHVEKTVADLGLLAQLTSAANDTDVPQRLRDFIPQPQSARPDPEVADAPASFVREPTAADHFEAFLTGMGFTDGDARRTMLAKQIADIIKTQDRHETAEELLSRFDPPASYAPDNDASDETPGL
ncbi:hypothetical protein BX264_0149 [Streptomyces sp. 2333.5]|uniref:hypothetical protein n=1 Tax=unclassified Streptomyces TaxID=2593676 RepID=UPI00089731EF|nr:MULTISPECIES: hypothetical protein [unclassified Streptomyces]PJI99880.1 hypothetical protein BX264_0149 [Streptomyces sp. 2333.5]SEB62897.1 hypothetical protein SAMN05428943_0147 [Streptomyces sp. 2314.4]SEC46936.1 hypothetical protein SAMN05428942_0148 [Streptomyces sp. 2112.2]